VSGDVDVAAVAALIGEPARAAVLMALADGRALAATTLAAEASVAPSTASEHLARLVDGGLVSVEAAGRHRYYRLARPEVAEAVEALARLAPHRPIRSLSQGTHAAALRRARTCYDHLAGRLGVALLDALLTHQLLDEQPAEGDDPVSGTARADRFPAGAARADRVAVTEAGRARLAELGVPKDPPGRRPVVRYCLDWSEQRPHLSGWLGAVLLDRFFALEWLVRRPGRVVKVTGRGWQEFGDRLGVDVAGCQ
jgi:DNA-binding transcriptional ArsR family regulator